MRPEPPPAASLFHRDRTPIPVIRGIEKLEGHTALRLPIPSRILTLEFQSALTSGNGVATLRLELAPNGAPHLRVQLNFHNVHELTLSSLPAEGIFCGGFAIDDARSLGRTKINWEISDVLSNTIHFYAEDAEIVSVTMAG